MRRIVAWVVVYATAMAFVEAAVVVYLRALGHGGPFIGQALPVLTRNIIAIEVVREGATLVMLVALGALAGRHRWERFLFFWLAFALWDLGYYGWLWVLSGWPPSLLTWDVLFLIPVPWTAPVLAPVLVSSGMVAAVAAALRLHAAGRRLASGGLLIAGLAFGGVLMFVSFVIDYRTAIAGQEPERFRWALFLAGFAICCGVFLAGVRKAGRA